MSTGQILPRVVIIGGGFGGLNAARALKHAPVEIVLIDRANHHLFQPLLYQVATSVLPPTEIASPIRQLLRDQHNVTVLMGEVTRVDITQQIVYVAGFDRPVAYDYLVLATGSSYPFPAKMASDKVTEAETAVRLVNERIAQAKSILLIGAGPVGIELAGEIASLYPGKLVTLMDPGERLMPAFNPKLGELLYAGLKQLGVRIMLGEKLVKMLPATNATASEQPTLQTYLTEKGTQIEADIHFICFGLQFNTQYLKLGSVVDEQKQVKVNSHLQVQGYENIFAIGDIVNTGEAKLITTADAHAKIVARNIERLAANNHSLLDHQPKSTATVVVPLGTTGGAVQLPLGKNEIVLGAWAASLIKGKTLRAPQRWKALGAIMPNDKR